MKRITLLLIITVAILTCYSLTAAAESIANDVDVARIAEIIGFSDAYIVADGPLESLGESMYTFGDSVPGYGKRMVLVHGYMSITGETIIEPRFRVAEPFSEGLAFVVNFDVLDYTDNTITPVLINGSTLVSRASFDGFLDFISNDSLTDANRQVTLGFIGKTLTFTIDSRTADLKYFDAALNDYVTEEITTNAPAQVINGNAFLPLRTVADCFGFDLYWDDASQIVGLGAFVAATLTPEQQSAMAQGFEKDS